MELIAGAQRLDTYVASRRLSVIERLTIVAKITDAIAHAHERGVLHLDLKPANILVRADGQPKILDFGAGQLMSGGDPANDGLAVVTPEYMSPEQATLERCYADARADVYAIGAIAYELIVGQRPYDFSGKAFSQIRELICGATPPRSISSLTGAARNEIAAVLARALAKSAETRYQSARELYADVNALIAGGKVSVVSNGPFVQLQRWLRRADHIPWSGQVLSVMAGLNAALCAWFIVVVVTLPSIRAVVAPDVRPEFVVHESLWVVFLGTVAVVARRAGRSQIVYIWTTVLAAFGVLTFTLAVASGAYQYDAAGAASSPQARGMVFTVISGFAGVAVLVSLLMLASYYVRRPWYADQRPGHSRLPFDSST